MKLRSQQLLIAVVIALSFGCASADPEPTLAGSSDGMLIGADSDDHAFWEQWTPGPAAEAEIDEALRPANVFDVWRTDDLAFQRPVFDATFHIISALDNSLDDDEASQVLRSLLLRLDPDHVEDQVHWELSFVTHQEGDAEGLVLRIVGADGAGLWIMAKRQAAGPTAATQWRLHADAAAKEVEPVSARWQSDDDDWDNWEELLQLWEQSLWDAVTGREYVEPGFEFRERQDSALGESVERRGLTDFVNDTVFLPRGELE